MNSSKIIIFNDFHKFQKAARINRETVFALRTNLKKCLAFQWKLRHYKIKDTAYKKKEEQNERRQNDVGFSKGKGGCRLDAETGAGPGMRQKRREDQNPQDVDLRHGRAYL